MKIYLLTALALVLFSTADLLAQSYPTSAPSDQQTSDGVIFSSSDSQPYVDADPIGYWNHSTSEDTATERVYRREADGEHTVVLRPDGVVNDHLTAKYGILGSGTGNWIQNDNKIIVTLDDNTKFIFLTDRITEGILIRVME